VRVFDRENACIPKTLSAQFQLRPTHKAGENMIDGIRMLPQINPSFSEQLSDVDETKENGSKVKSDAETKTPVKNDYS
jgi:hypothetical protein